MWTLLLDCIYKSVSNTNKSNNNNDIYGPHLAWLIDLLVRVSLELKSQRNAFVSLSFICLFWKATFIITFAIPYVIATRQM